MCVRTNANENGRSKTADQSLKFTTIAVWRSCRQHAPPGYSEAFVVQNWAAFTATLHSHNFLEFKSFIIPFLCRFSLPVL